MLPHDLSAWESVYTDFKQWRDDGTWERLNRELRIEVRLMRDRMGYLYLTGFFKSNSLPQIGKLFQTNEISFYSGRVGYPEDVDGLFTPYRLNHGNSQRAIFFTNYDYNNCNL